MATKTTFDFNSENVTSGFQKVFDSIQKSKIRVSSSSGKTCLNLPLLFAVVIGIIFPVVTVFAVLLTLVSVIRMTIEQEIIEDKKMIELK